MAQTHMLLGLCILVDLRSVGGSTREIKTYTGTQDCKVGDKASIIQTYRWALCYLLTEHFCSASNSCVEI